MYRLKHVPTGLYFQPLKSRGSHLSKTGKVYHTKTNGFEINKNKDTFLVSCQKNSMVYKKTKDILNWEEVPYYYNTLRAETKIDDWIKEEIN